MKKSKRGLWVVPIVFGLENIDVMVKCSKHDLKGQSYCCC